MRRYMIAVVLGTSALLTGCAGPSMIRTVDRTLGAPTDEEARRLAYLGDYALPRSRFVVTIAAPGPASPTPTVPTVSNTITVNPPTATTTTTTGGGPPATADRPTPPSIDVAGWCRGLREEYGRNQRLIASARIAYQGLQARSDALAQDADLAPADRTVWKADLALQAELLPPARQGYRRNLDLAAPITTHCPQPIRVSIAEIVERDESRVFALYAAEDDVASDTLTWAIDANGFLTSLSGTANDRSLEIGVNVVKTLATVSTYYRPALQIDPQVNVTASDCRGPDSSAEAVRLAATQYSDESAITPITIDCALGYLALPPPLDEIELPLPLEVSVLVDGDPGPNDKGVVEEPLVFSQASSLNLTGTLRCAVGVAAPRTFNAVSSGLVVSTGMPCAIEVSRRLGSNPTPVVIAQANTWSLNSTRTALLETPRSPFVTQVSSYGFAAGRPTGGTWTRPSPTEQVVTAPLRLLGTVTGVLADAVTGGTNDIKAETARLTAETERLNAQAALVTAQAAADRAAAERATPGAAALEPASGPQ